MRNGVRADVRVAGRRKLMLRDALHLAGRGPRGNKSMSTRMRRVSQQGCVCAHVLSDFINLITPRKMHSICCNTF